MPFSPLKRVEGLANLLVGVDQPIGRRIVCGHRSITAQFRLDGFRQLLAQFHTPLIERVDIPDHALRENFMLIERDQRAERFGVQLPETGTNSTVYSPRTFSPRSADQTANCCQRRRIRRAPVPAFYPSSALLFARRNSPAVPDDDCPAELSVRAGARKSQGISFVP